jgi:hypothetical protein
MKFFVKILIPVLAIFLTSCGHLPSTRVKANEYSTFDADLDHEVSSSTEEVVAKDIKLYQGQYPKGIMKNGDLLSVQDEYKDKIELLGTVSINLKWGKSTAPFLFGPKLTVYVADDDITGVHKYCKAVSFQQFIPFYNFLNHIYPWNYPCYFIEDRSSEDTDDIDYRLSVLEKSTRDAAKEMGGNVVIGYNVGGVSYVNTATGATLSNHEAWSSSGYVIRIK